jgi:hypothetical protein
MIALPVLLMPPVACACDGTRRFGVERVTDVLGVVLIGSARCGSRRASSPVAGGTARAVAAGFDAATEPGSDFSAELAVKRRNSATFDCQSRESPPARATSGAPVRQTGEMRGRVHGGT